MMYNSVTESPWYPSDVTDVGLHTGSDRVPLGSQKLAGKDSSPEFLEACQVLGQ